MVVRGEFGPHAAGLGASFAGHLLILKFLRLQVP